MIYSLLDTNDKKVLEKENPPDATAWGLHGSLHKNCRHARCVMHVHSVHATVLASMKIVSTTNKSGGINFFNRQIIDNHYGGLAFEEEGERCSKLLENKKFTTMIMGNHGYLVIGQNVAEAFHRLFYFERAAEILC